MFKHARLLIAAVLCLFLFAYTAQPVSAEGSNIVVKVEEGFDGKIKRGKGFPLSITIENSGSAFSGDLLIQYQPSYNTGGALAIPVELPEGSSKTYQVSVPGLTEDRPSAYQNTPTIFLYEGDWQKGKETPFKGDNTMKPTYFNEKDQVIGVLSENYDRLKELRVLPNVATQMVPLSKEMLPDHALGLETLDYLIIDEFPVSQLSEDQQLAIKDWIQNGGVLIAGAVPNANNSYGHLSSLLPMKLTEEINGTTEFLQNNGEVAFENIPLFTGEVDQSAEVIAKSGDAPAALKQTFGDGAILQTGFSLGDQPLASWQGYGAWFEDFIVQAKPVTSTTGQYHGPPLYDSLYWDFAETNEYFHSSNYSISQLILMIAIYLMILVPILYVVLRKLDKREHSWWIIPSMAIIASAIIFGLGAKDRMAQPQLNQMGVYTVNDKGLTGLQATTLLSNKSGEYTLSLPKNQFHAVPKISNYGSNAVVKEQRDNQVITFNDVGYWSSKTIFGKAHTDSEGHFITDLTLKNNQLTGTIENHFPYDFNELFIWSGNERVLLGEVKAGETIQVKEELNQQWLSAPSGANYSGMHPSQQTDLDQLKTERLEYAASMYLLDDSLNQPVIGGVTEEEIVDVQMEGKNAIENNLHMILSPFEAKTEITGEFTLNSDLLLTRLEVIHGHIFEERMPGRLNEAHLEDGEYHYIIQLPSQLDDKQVMLENLNITVNQQFGQFSIQNQDTNEFMRIGENAGTWEVTKENGIDQYFTEKGELIIKFQKSTQGDPYVQLPKVTVKGEVLP